jgi:hypothetical protein
VYLTFVEKAREWNGIFTEVWNIHIAIDEVCARKKIRRAVMKREIQGRQQVMDVVGTGLKVVLLLRKKRIGQQEMHTRFHRVEKVYLFSAEQVVVVMGEMGKREKKRWMVFARARQELVQAKWPAKRARRALPAREIGERARPHHSECIPIEDR